MNLETCLQMLMKINKHADSEFRNLKISHMNIWRRCLHKVNKLPEIKNETRDLLTNVNKGKQAC